VKLSPTQPPPQPPPQPRSLHAQAVSANFLPVAATAVFVVTLFVSLSLLQLRAFQKELHLRAQSLAESLARQSELAVWLRDQDELRRIANAVAAVEGVLYVVVGAGAGDPLAVATGENFPASDIPATSPSGQANWDWHGATSGQRFLEATVPVQSHSRLNALDWEHSTGNGATIGKVRIGLSTLMYHTLYWRSLWSMLSGSLLSLILILAVQRRQMRRVLAPLKSLIAFARHVSQGDLTSRAPVVSHDEVGELAIACNEMVEGLELSRRQLLHAVDSAQQSSRLKSEFLANMSHEIRTPLNGMIGMTELALDADLPSETREQLKTALVSANSLMSILNDILDLSKIEAGKLDLDEVPFDIAAEVEQTARSLAVQAHLKGVEVICDIQAGLPQLVLGDPSRLRQVLTNLIGNAVKFTSVGEIVVSVMPETSLRDYIRVCFTISDTGIGIPAGKLQAIFEPFTQADGSTARQYGGTGLGLAICTRLVAKMGGQLGVDSEPGKGSSFYFTATFFGPSPELDEPAPWEALTGVRALVADDNGTSRQVLHSILKAWGLEVETAASGTLAAQLVTAARAAGRPFDIALLDTAMPGMDGFETASCIQHQWREQAPGLIMLSSSGVQADGLLCKRLGVSRYVMKPVGRAELGHAIRATLNPESKPAIEPVLPLDPSGALSILVAEDNAVNRKVIESLLTRAGHRVHLVHDGGDAIAAWNAQHFDIILMDIQMPGIDGYEATRHIRDHEKHTGLHTPIIALTAHALKGDREQCLQKGMDDYVTKPVSRQRLFEAIRTVSTAFLQRR